MTGDDLFDRGRAGGSAPTCYPSGDACEDAADGSEGGGVGGDAAPDIDEGYVEARVGGDEVAAQAVGFAAAAADGDAVDGMAQAALGDGDEKAVGCDGAARVDAPDGTPGIGEGRRGSGVGVGPEEARYGGVGTEFLNLVKPERHKGIRGGLGDRGRAGGNAPTCEPSGGGAVVLG